MTRAACAKCGGEKGPGRGRKYCDDCRELSRWVRRKKYATRSIVARQPCMKCGGAKPAGKGHRYCLKCKAPKVPPRRCIDCGAEIERPFLKCGMCKALTAERERRRQRDRARHARNRRAGRAEHRERDRQRDNETRRIKARERAEREGRKIPELPASRYERRYGDGRGKHAPRVDTAPLIGPLAGSDVQIVGFQADVDDSFLYRILRGEQTTISVKDADALCLALGLTFTEVYGEMAQIA